MSSPRDVQRARRWLLPAIPARLLYCGQVALSAAASAAIQLYLDNALRGDILIPVIAIATTSPTTGATVMAVRSALLGALLAVTVAGVILAALKPSELVVCLALVPVVLGIVNFSIQPVFQKIALASFVVSIVIGFDNQDLGRKTYALWIPLEVLASASIGGACSVLVSSTFFPTSAAWEVALRLKISLRRVIFADSALLGALSSRGANISEFEARNARALRGGRSTPNISLRVRTDSTSTASIDLNWMTPATVRADLLETFAKEDANLRASRLANAASAYDYAGLVSLVNRFSFVVPEPEVRTHWRLLLTRLKRLAQFAAVAEKKFRNTIALQMFSRQMAGPLAILTRRSGDALWLAMNEPNRTDYDDHVMKIEDALENLFDSYRTARTEVWRVAISSFGISPGETRLPELRRDDQVVGDVEAFNAFLFAYIRSAMRIIAALSSDTLRHRPVGSRALSPTPATFNNTLDGKNRTGAGAPTGIKRRGRGLGEEDHHSQDSGNLPDVRLTAIRIDSNSAGGGGGGSSSNVSNTSSGASGGGRDTPSPLPFTSKPPSTTTTRLEPAAQAPSAPSHWRWLVHKMDPRRLNFSRFRLAVQVTVAIELATIYALTPGLAEASGIWAPLTVAFVAGDTVGGSFKQSLNRLIGTVMGAVYAYLVASEITDEIKWIIVPLLAAWVFVSSYVRTSPGFEYAGTVSAFTAAIILLEDYSQSETDIALIRIRQTCVGILIFLVVANLVFPRRASQNARNMVLDALERAQTVAEESSKFFLLAFQSFKNPHTAGILEKLAEPLDKIDVALDRIDSLSRGMASVIAEGAAEPEIFAGEFPAHLYIKFSNTLALFRRFSRGLQYAGSWIRGRIEQANATDESISEDLWVLSEALGSDEMLDILDSMAEALPNAIAQMRVALGVEVPGCERDPEQALMMLSNEATRIHVAMESSREVYRSGVSEMLWRAVVKKNNRLPASTDVVSFNTFVFCIQEMCMSVTVMAQDIRRIKQMPVRPALTTNPEELLRLLGSTHTVVGERRLSRSVEVLNSTDSVFYRSTDVLDAANGGNAASASAASVASEMSNNNFDKDHEHGTAFRPFRGADGAFVSFALPLTDHHDGHEDDVTDGHSDNSGSHGGAFLGNARWRTTQL
eukprot:m.131876 g.131876  ORF g.131876 m.131876 type:complete len:1137 (+) comp9821_c0_seq4:164-3574(+)